MTALDGRTALVTGAGRGIGAAIARVLSGAGASVVLSARRAQEIEAIAGEIRTAGRRAWAVPADVTDPEAVVRLAAVAAAETPGVDILVNNAGQSYSAPLARTTLEDWNRLLAVNATGTFLVTRALLPAMVERGWGRVINMASVSGISGAPYISAYAAAKHAVVGFTRAIAAEIAGSGVTVNAVCPTYVDTDMTRESIARIVKTTGRTEEEARAAIIAMTPQGRLVTPDEVARGVLSLCDEQAKDVNGEALVIDGGKPA